MKRRRDSGDEKEQQSKMLSAIKISPPTDHNRSSKSFSACSTPHCLKHETTEYSKDRTGDGDRFSCTTPNSARHSCILLSSMNYQENLHYVVTQMRRCLNHDGGEDTGDLSQVPPD